MKRTRSLNPIVAVLAVVVASLAFASLAQASYESPAVEAAASYQLPMNGGAFAIVRDWLPYVVQSNESLHDIAERFGVPAAVLAHTNGISDFESLAPGQVVWIPMLANEVISVAPSYVKATSATVLYAGPSADFGISAKVSAGEAAMVLGRSADGLWLSIASVSNPSSAGWIKADSALFRLFSLPVAPR